MAVDPVLRDHKAWLGYLQPDGLVVSPAALADAQVVLNRNVAPLQRQFLEFVDAGTEKDPQPATLISLRETLMRVLEWPEDCLYGLNGDRPISEELRVSLMEFGETLEPQLALEDPHAEEAKDRWILLVQEVPEDQDLDAPIESALAGWAASPTRRFERLLREAQVPIGLLSNRRNVRLIYAPRGENAGTLTFPVHAMAETAGRSILSAFEMLLSSYSLLSAPSAARLPSLLQKSREYQSLVSTQLAEQVLDALYELLRGFQVADNYIQGALLRDVLAEHADEIYNGLLTVLMRLVFLLYSEDRGLMPTSELYVRNYSVHGLFEQLRADAERYTDTMDHRYGAWAQLIALFRIVHDGCKHPLIQMPARRGHLFDPERFPFLEGQTTEEGHLPLVADGVLYRVLDKLLILDGERLSYRTLDVEQIGSVYETMMGFRLEVTDGQTIALKPAKAHGAPVPANLDELLAEPASDRAKWIKDRTDYKLTAKMTRAVKPAASVNDLLVALEKRIARNATPQPVPAGTMVLMPTDERRKTGSHYTPRSLTEPIVRTTIEPILDQLGDKPTPEQILDLKVCDPAMGSGAFLVQACRQLADELIKAWANHGYEPEIPPDEDAVLYARRVISQRCLYGVDKNPMAVDLAKLSLWLATLAKDHPFTFLDHSLRCGDSLVGLTREQIISFHWEASKQLGFLEGEIRERMERVGAERAAILSAGDDMPPEIKRQRLALADDALSHIRMLGDAVISAFFAGSRKKERQENRDALFERLQAHYLQDDVEAMLALENAAKNLQELEYPVRPLHWEIEFPEVFAREEPGFDGFVGNPPFMGGQKLSNSLSDQYLSFIKDQFPETRRMTDLVAYFLRRAYWKIRVGGALGMVATNTVSQGDTRIGGLKRICESGGVIYAATRRLQWPGRAAVVVSVVHCSREFSPGTRRLDGVVVPLITSYFHTKGNDDEPKSLAGSTGIAFSGGLVYGAGFLFDDSNDGSSPLKELERILATDSRYEARVFKYLGGEDILRDPRQDHKRYVMDLNDLDEEQAREWPEFMNILEEKVKPERMKLRDTPDSRRYKRYWWKWGRTSVALNSARADLERVLVHPFTSTHVAFSFVEANVVVGAPHIVVAIESLSGFACLQCRAHECWARFFSSSLKDDLRYTPSDCFETFPFPKNWDSDPNLDEVGKTYYDFRADLMIGNDEGLTKTYNRFHDPHETSPDILRLRELHAAMDRAVLDAYGWTDILPTCEFLLDYEEEDADSNSRKKKPWRYRWPDEIHDEVLARLLALNAERAEEERRAGLTGNAKKASGGPKKPKPGPEAPLLIEDDFEEETDA